MMGPVKFVGFCFLVFAAFGAGFYYSEFSNTEPFVAYAKTPAGETQAVSAAQLANASGDYCAILTMPRSYIPLLERLKRKKIKDVVITPARIENENGRLTAVAEKAVESEKIAEHGNDDALNTDKSTMDKEDTSIFGALAVYFLAGSKQQKAP